VQDVNERGEKAFFKSEMDISTFQNVGHNLNGSPDTAYSKFGPNYELYDELNRFTGSLIYSIQRFIFFCHGPKKRGHGTIVLPLNTLLIVASHKHCSQKSVNLPVNLQEILVFDGLVEINDFANNEMR